jgi:hypothetical protein
MSYFARIHNGLVVDVNVAEREVLDTGLWGHPDDWIQTDPNTRGNVHYSVDGQPDGGIALRGNYAGIGYTYNRTNDVFYAPQPYPSWTLNTSNWTWQPPTPYPADGKLYDWNESTLRWILEPKQPV